MKSVSFDQAAGYYDETRGFPPGVGEVVAEAAAELIDPAQRVLEVGIGTGRIARPMIARGYTVTGVDLSRKMMARLLEALPPAAPRLALAEGDAVHLPFAARSFDAAVSVHVFHLIAGWHEAAEEVRRCLKPGGVLLSGHDWRPDDHIGTQLQRRWREILKEHGWGQLQPGAHDFDDVRVALVADGATCEDREVGNWESTRTLARHLESIEHRTWSGTWPVPEGLFPECLEELRAWALERWGSLDREFTTPHRFKWHAFRWDEAGGNHE